MTGKQEGERHSKDKGESVQRPRGMKHPEISIELPVHQNDQSKGLRSKKTMEKQNQVCFQKGLGNICAC